MLLYLILFLFPDVISTFAKNPDKTLRAALQRQKRKYYKQKNRAKSKGKSNNKDENDENNENDEHNENDENDESNDNDENDESDEDNDSFQHVAKKIFSDL